MLAKIVLPLLFIVLISAGDLSAGGNLVSIVLSSDSTISNAELLFARDSSIVILYPPNVSEETLTRKGVIVMEIQKSAMKSITLIGAGGGHGGTGAIIGAFSGIAVAGASLSGVVVESNTGTHRADAALVVLGLTTFGLVGAGVGALLGSTFKEDIIIEPSSLQTLSPLNVNARYENQEPEFLKSVVMRRIGN